MALVLMKQRRLKKAEEFFSLGKQKRALQLAKPLLKVSDKTMAHSANRLSGLALYQQKKYQDSLPYLQAACQLGNYQHDWYNYAMSLAYSGQAEQANEAFQNIYRTKVQAGYMHTATIPIMLFQLVRAFKLKGNIDLAKARINELKRMYTGIGVLNTTNELSRGLPTYHNFKRQIAPLYDAEEWEKWEKENLKLK